MADSQPAVPGTPSALRVLGVVASGDGRGWALIASGDGPAQVIALGASTPDGTQVIALSGEQVRFRDAGGREFVRPLEVATTAPAAVPPPVPRTPVTPGRDPAGEVSPIVPPDVGMRAPSAAESATAGSYWSRLRDGESAAQAEANNGAPVAAPAGPRP